jgi:hypothetical protein
MAEKFTASLKKLFFHPKKFFDSVEKDRNYSKIMFFYVKASVIAAIVSLVCSLILLSFQNKLAGAGVFSLITSAVIGVGMAFLIPFIASFIVHIGVWIFRGKQGYFNTYKVIAYSLAIALIYGIFSTIIVSIIGITNPVSISQESLAANPALIFQEKGYIASIAVSLIIFLVSLIHSLAVQVIGISRFQKMSKLRAFFAIIIIPLVLLIIGISIIINYINQLAASA